jgi:hypothetical protein
MKYMPDEDASAADGLEELAQTRTLQTRQEARVPKVEDIESIENGNIIEALAEEPS